VPSASTDRKKPADANLGKRLDCWKEIAAYLGRGERTVKRWEMERGLPSHRVPGAGRTAVYAYTAELDEWLKSRKAQEMDAAEVDAEEPESGRLFGFGNETGRSAVVSTAILEADPPRSILRRIWLLAFSGLLLATAVGTVAYSDAGRAVGSQLSARFHSLFRKSRSNSDPAGAKVVSDAEKSQARELYLRGRYEWSQRTPSSLNRALDYFTQAILHDPGNAQAYVGMADTYDLLREYSSMPDSDAYARAGAAARKAVELDDSLAEAHRALAFEEWWGEWDFVDGEKEFRRAIELNPKDPIAHKWFANVLSVQGRFPEALEENEKAQELDPSSSSTLADKGLLLFSAGRRMEAIELLKQVERSAPEFPSTHNYLMTMSLDIRDYPSYLEEGKKTAEIENDPVLKDIIASAKIGFERDGERGLLNNLYARQKEYYKEGKLWGTRLAITCAKLGKKREALQLLEEAYNHHEWYVLSCKIGPDMVSLKDEPRYKALLKKINFPEAPVDLSPSPPVSAVKARPSATPSDR